MLIVKCILFIIIVLFFMFLENLFCNGISLFFNKIGEILEGLFVVNIVDVFLYFK